MSQTNQRRGVTLTILEQELKCALMLRDYLRGWEGPTNTLTSLEDARYQLEQHITAAIQSLQ